MDVNEWRSAFSVQRSAFGGAVRRVGVSACRRNDMVVAPHRVEPFNCAESLMFLPFMAIAEFPCCRIESFFCLLPTTARIVVDSND
jgi:hypothetical protein